MIPIDHKRDKTCVSWYDQGKPSQNMHLKIYMHLRGPRLISRYLIIDSTLIRPSPQLSCIKHVQPWVLSCMLLTKCTLIFHNSYWINTVTVIGRVALVVMSVARQISHVLK